MAGTLAQEVLPIDLEFLHSLIILMQASDGGISLGLNEKVHLTHAGHNVIGTDQFGPFKLRVLIFCFLQKSIMDTFPRDIVPPVWLLKSVWTLKDVSTRQWTRLMSVTSKVRPSDRCDQYASVSSRNEY